MARGPKNLRVSFAGRTLTLPTATPARQPDYCSIARISPPIMARPEFRQENIQIIEAVGPSVHVG